MSHVWSNNCGDTYDAAAAAAGQVGWAAMSGTIVAGRVAGGAIRLVSPTIITTQDASHLYTAHAEGTLHFGLMRESADGSEINIMTLLEGATVHLQFAITTGGAIRIKRNGTTLATGSTVLSVGVWYQVVWHYKIHDSTGEIHVWLDGASEISSTGLDTRNGATGVTDNIALRSGSNGVAYRWDDLHCWTGNDNKSFSRVIGMVADGNGAHDDWDKSSGSSGAAMVDDNPPDGDTTCIISDTTAQRQSVTFGDLPVDPASTVHAVVGRAIVRKQDVGTRSLFLFTREGGSDFDGSPFNPALSFETRNEVREVNPDTTSAWTVAEANGYELGIGDAT